MDLEPATRALHAGFLTVVEQKARQPARRRALGRMIKTHGLTHIAISVRDPGRSLRFYEVILGVVPIYRERDFIQAQTPGSRDVLVFQRGTRRLGDSGGIAHFGFRLQNAADIQLAIETVKKAGGEIRDSGDFCPGEPYVFFTDPDGYEVEIWYELPTPVDPPS